MPVPETFKNFPIRKQGEQDYACGLYCVVSAATHLGALPDEGDGVADVLARIDRNISTTISKNLLTSGVSDRGVRLLAGAANLGVWRPKNATLKDLAWNDGKCEHVWMALVRMSFVDPNGIVESYRDLHYVLVLGVADAKVVVADPHPWHENISVMSTSAFSSAWIAARGRGKPRWAGCLYRRGK